MKLLILFSLFTLSASIHLTEFDLSSYSIKNFLYEVSLYYIGGGIEIVNDIPSATEVFEDAKQLLIGYPFETLLGIADSLCSAALNADIIKPNAESTPTSDKVEFVLTTPCAKATYPISDSNKLWKDPSFDPNKLVVVFITGWLTDTNTNELINQLSGAFYCRNDTNLIIVDPEKYLGEIYSWSAYNTDALGELIAEGLISLDGIVPRKNIHIIGISLGAQVAGYVGRYYKKKTSKSLGRITGLDPAAPCFNVGQRLDVVSRSDADFVDIIHTNPGIYGVPISTGHADFYISGDISLVPGCKSASCSHVSSFFYYVETIYPNNKYNFIATHCSSLKNVRLQKCLENALNMGFDVPTDITEGDYFLEVNTLSPYGTNATLLSQNENDDCTMCKQKKY